MNIWSGFLRTTYWIRDFLKGSPIRSHYRDIKSIMEDFDNGERKRARYLKKLLNYAVNNCSFYSKFTPDSLNSFPVINKSILIAHYDAVRVNAKSIPFQKGDVFIQKTSGSTGIPFAVPQGTSKRNRRVAELKYFGEQAGFRSHDKLVHLRAWNRWQSKSKYKSLRENIIPFNITHITDARLKELCHIINQKKVLAVRGYASSIDILARYASDHEVNLPSLKLMIAGSESLLDGTREIVKNKIGCQIISQYANEENGILAQECFTGEGRSPFYLNHASYFFEVLKLDKDEPAGYGAVGRIVITDLFNYAFPIIRYDTGDTGILLSNNEFSNQYPVIQQLYGRRLDLIFDTKGEIVYPMAIARVLKHFSDILQWQFIQTGKKDYLLKLIVRDKHFDDSEIKKDLISLFGDNAIIHTEFINEIPVLASGKRKPVVNNWKV